MFTVHFSVRLNVPARRARLIEDTTNESYCQVLAIIGRLTHARVAVRIGLLCGQVIERMYIRDFFKTRSYFALHCNLPAEGSAHVLLTKLNSH